MKDTSDLRRAAAILRDGHQVRPAPGELADLLARAARGPLPCPTAVENAAHALAVAMTTVPPDEPLDPRLTEVTRETT